MKLTGIIEDVFRGVTIFRGYATLKTLARLSASTSYQRDKDPDRIDAIKDYISNSSYVFYPELILGWQLDNPDAIRIIKEEENTSSVSLNNGIKIKKAKFKFKSLPLGEEPKTKVVTIEIPDSINETIFNRIDGNHRLSVVDKIKDETGIYDSEICNQIVPFSLIIQNKSNDANKFESAYFYLINSKAKALTTEENLKAIFKADHFTKSEKKELLSIETDTVIEAIGKCAEELAQRNLHIVNNIFDGCVYSLSYDICREFENPNIDAITSSISYINDEYFLYESPDFTRSCVYTLIKARVANHKLYGHFKKWIHSHHLENKEDISSKTLWTMFDTMINSDLKVFIAMPYFKKQNGNEPDEVLMNDYREIYKRCFESITNDTGRPIHMFPIMNDSGLSEDMIDNIMDEIENCDIFIADITYSNPNVLYELGRAHALRKNCIIVKSDIDSGTSSDIRNIRHYLYKSNSKSTTLLSEVKKNIVAYLDTIV